MTTHGKTEPAKIVKLFCNTCNSVYDCYDFSKMKVCANCLMTIDGGLDVKNVTKTTTHISNSSRKVTESQGELF